MSYEPTTWKDGDLVTSAKLNKLENGVAAAGGPSILIVHVNAETGALDKTWQEMYDADVCYLTQAIETPIVLKTTIQVTQIDIEDNNYAVLVWIPGTQNMLNFYASGPNDYPIRQETSSNKL